jgi:hypothetical protein
MLYDQRSRYQLKVTPKRERIKTLKTQHLPTENAALDEEDITNE